jgi:Flp pilus assembly pilin Flp
MILKNHGQAVVEYLVIFAFLAMISIAMARFLGGFLGNTATSLAFQLSNHLSSGVCPQMCFFDGFENGQN